MAPPHPSPKSGFWDCEGRTLSLKVINEVQHLSGAVGYLLKDAPSENLFAAIRAAARGESFLQPSVTTRVLAEFTRLSDQPPSSATLVEPLSDREHEILRLIAKGSTNREIAEALFITEGTVKNHVTNILSKLDVRDRTQAALKARELGYR